MTKFKCPCKYTYDPEKGDPKQNIPPSAGKAMWSAALNLQQSRMKWLSV